MTAALFALLVGALVAAGLWLTAGRALDAAPLQRTNYRGAVLPTAGGIFIPVTLMLVVALGHLFLLAARRGLVWEELGRPALMAASSFALLGLFDDVAGEGQSGGFRGHLKALGRGELTSGMVKLVAGGAVGVMVASTVPSSDVGVLAALRDGASIALAANLANLFDRAPGRSIKFSTLAFLAAMLVARTADGETVERLAGPALGVGAAIGLLGADLRERMMLGDTGANPLGALVGLAWLVALPSATGRWFLLVALLALNASSELVSFSAVINGAKPLRWFDRLGSLRD